MSSRACFEAPVQARIMSHDILIHSPPWPGRDLARPVVSLEGRIIEIWREQVDQNNPIKMVSDMVCRRVSILGPL